MENLPPTSKPFPSDPGDRLPSAGLLPTSGQEWSKTAVLGSSRKSMLIHFCRCATLIRYTYTWPDLYHIAVLWNRPTVPRSFLGRFLIQAQKARCVVVKDVSFLALSQVRRRLDRGDSPANHLRP